MGEEENQAGKAAAASAAEKSRTWRKILYSPKTGFPLTMSLFAAMAELADALDSGSSGGNSVDVRVILAAIFSFLGSVCGRPQSDPFSRDFLLAHSQAGPFWRHWQNGISSSTNHLCHPFLRSDHFVGAAKMVSPLLRTICVTISQTGSVWRHRQTDKMIKSSNASRGATHQKCTKSS